MNPIRRMFGKMFHQAPEPVKVAKPKDEHYTIPVPGPKSKLQQFLDRYRHPNRFKSNHPLGVGHGMHRLKHICGHPVRPLLRAQKRDLEKLWGVKLP